VRDRRARRGGGLTPVDPEQVRSLLERAVAVAREGEAATPVVPAPKELQPVLRFRTLPGPALATVLRLLDEDEAFLARVREATSAEDLDAAGWLALERPPGWQELLARASAPGLADEAERRLKDLQRRLEGSERRLALADEELGRAQAEAGAARAERDEVRRGKRKAEDALAEAARLIDELKEKLGDRDRRLADAQGAREAREHELAEARGQTADLQAELGRRPPAVAPGERPVDVGRLRAAAAELEAATAALASAVAAVGDQVPAAPEPAAAVAAEAAPARRRPLRMPGGVVEDSAAGARWLFERPGVVAIVDGYNLAKRAWPGQELPEQRRRLVGALDALALRAGAAIEVVFDGPADAESTGGRSTRSVQVRFSGGVEADGVVVGMVGGQPLDRPVVVVSNDREVKDGAHRAGANVVGSDAVLQLLKG
jgi:YacP-like NYN domain